MHYSITTGTHTLKEQNRELRERALCVQEVNTPSNWYHRSMGKGQRVSKLIQYTEKNKTIYPPDSPCKRAF